MGILDGLESVMSGQGGGVANTLFSMLASERGGTGGGSTGQSPAAVSGGLGELVQRLEQGGLGDAVQSWIGPGTNAAVAPDQLGQALGPQLLGRLSENTGLGHGQLLPLLAQALPAIVDRLTPNNRLPSESEVAPQQSQRIDV